MAKARIETEFLTIDLHLVMRAVRASVFPRRFPTSSTLKSFSNCTFFELRTDTVAASTRKSYLTAHKGVSLPARLGVFTVELGGDLDEVTVHLAPTVSDGTQFTLTHSSSKVFHLYGWEDYNAWDRARPSVTEVDEECKTWTQSRHSMTFVEVIPTWQCSTSLAATTS